MKNDWKSLINNPLGIIGFFLVIVEGMASLVITNSSLEWYHNLVLVIFIVLFPMLVLRVFYKLVSEHSDKLYSPKDFKDEKLFMDYINKDTGKAIKIKPFKPEEIELDEQFKAEIKKIANIKPFNEKLSTLIRVNSRITKFEQIISLLKDNGFNTVSYYPEDRFEQELIEPEINYNAIWIGKNTSYNTVKEVFEILKTFDFGEDFSIRNIYINDEASSEIFIGAYHNIRIPNFKQITSINYKEDFDKVSEIYKAYTLI